MVNDMEIRLLPQKKRLGRPRRKKPYRRGRLLVYFLRSIRGSLGRYLSIFVITALGVAFFSGLRSVGADMRATAQSFFASSRFMDIRLLSTGGFTDKDVETVRATEGVSEVYPAYSAEALAQLDAETLNVRFHSIAPEGGLNQLVLIEGRMPDKSGECLMDTNFTVRSGLQVGDTVRFVAGGDSDLSDMLKTDSFTIVGIARTPLYISTERGASTVGSGETDAYCFIQFEDFSYSAYTELNLAITQGASLDRYSSAYERAIEPIEDALEALGEARSASRYEELQTEGHEKLDDAKRELSEGEQELEDAAQKLKDARAELDEGWQDYLDGVKTYEDSIKKAKNSLRKGRAQYEQGLQDYEAGLAEYETSRRDVYATLNESEAALKEARAEYEASLAAYNAADAYCSALEGALALGNTPEAAATIGALAPQAGAIDQNLALALSYFASSPGDAMAYATALQAVSGFRSSLTQNGQALEEGNAKLTEGEAEYAAGRAFALRQLREAAEQLDTAKTELDEAAQTLQEGEKKLRRAQREGQEELDEAKQKLEDGEAEYADGNAEYIEEAAKAEPEMEDARKKIADGEQALIDLKEPEWYVLDQDENIGFNSFEQDTERLDALSQVIPAVFFLVVALVVMTSMTRLVDSDRTHIGTLKALGYRNAAIASNYLLYAISASVFGCFVGVAFGPTLFPSILFNAYKVTYTLPPLITVYDPALMVLSVLVAVLSAALPAWLICLRSLRSTPADLIRPRAPSPGKRIILERLPFLWKRLSFSQKVSVRNLFRYKKRFLMTVFGVASCTALMFTGFALNDSIRLILPKQFEMLHTYDLQLTLAENLSDGDRADVNKAIDREKDITLSVPILQKNFDLSENGVSVTAVLTAPFSMDGFSQAIQLRERIGRKALTLDDSGVILTEKLASLLSLKVGDRFTVSDGDGGRASLTVSGITENYLAHYIYITPTLYEAAFGKTAEPNAALMKLAEAGEDETNALCARLLEQEGVMGVSLTNTMRGSLQKVMSALNAIVLVLIVSAAALVFVVLFSLNTINLEERARELATLKVLGFYIPELTAYIYRENIWLTGLGILFGLLMGVGLERYVIATTEVNLLMFCRDILPGSYLYSAALTALFAALVNLFMLRHFRKIDMVSSLKSME